jgi:anti-anti-sigma factor
MSQINHYDGHQEGDGAAGTANLPGRSPRLFVRTLPRTVIARLEDAEILVDRQAARATVAHLAHVVHSQGPAPLVLNLRGVRYLSGSVLGGLVMVQKDLDRKGCPVTLCGLDPLMHDVLRACRLDRVFVICRDEAESVGLIPT